MSATPESSRTAPAPLLDDVVRVLLDAVENDHVVISIPGTSYRLRLACENADALRPRIGRRIRGRIAGRALRMHVASAGGRFIEPAEGMPRIVQGSVQSAESRSEGGIGRVLVDIAVPVWVEPMPEQCFTEIAFGDLVNFYMQSGTRFVPID